MNSEYRLIKQNDDGSVTLLKLSPRRQAIILCTALAIFSFVSIGIASSFRSGRIIYNGDNFTSVKFYHSSCGKSSDTKQSNHGFGYPEQLIEDLIRDKEISIVLPVYDAHRVEIVNLLRSMRNLCIGCTEVPVIVVTDDKSKEAIYNILYNDTSVWPGEAAIAKSFPQLSIKLLREVLPYYAVNNWTDESHLINGKYAIQSHKKMFGILNGASTRFSWMLDVDSFVFKPMVLKKMLRDYLSLPYIITSHNWPVQQTLIPCAQNLTRSFLSTGYTIEVTHWIFDREIVSDLNDLVLTQYPTWHVPLFKTHLYFFELTYYHFLMSNQIQHRKYMQYKIIEIRTLFGGDESPLLQAIAKNSQGGLIEKIGFALTNVPSIYHQVVHIWKELNIFVFRPDGSELVALDFALDTKMLVMTNHFREELYRMSQSGYWNNPILALNNAEKQGWKSVADHLKQRKNRTKTSGT
jgi:hypothetical protein